MYTCANEFGHAGVYTSLFDVATWQVDFHKNALKPIKSLSPLQPELVGSRKTLPLCPNVAQNVAQNSILTALYRHALLADLPSGVGGLVRRPCTFAERG